MTQPAIIVSKNFIYNNEETPFFIHLIEKSTKNRYTHTLLVGAPISTNFLKGNVYAYITIYHYMSIYVYH